MRPPLPILIVLATLTWACPSWADEQVLPETVPMDHYKPLWENSPFGMASAKDASETYQLVGFFRVGSVSYATLLEKQGGRKLVISSLANTEDMRLVSIDFNANPLATAATITKGGETIVVKFDPNVLKAQPTAGAPAVQPQPNPAMPGRTPPWGSGPPPWMNTNNPFIQQNPNDPQRMLRRRGQIENSNPTSSTPVAPPAPPQ